MRFTLENHSLGLLIFLAILSRLLLFIAVGLSLTTQPLELLPGQWQAFPEHPWLDGWARWDSGWYADIASKGYIANENIIFGESRNTAFFPLYPLLVAALTIFTGNVFISGILVANLCFLAALCVIYRLVKEKSSAETAFNTGLLLMCFPYAFYFNTMYSESLFLLLCVTSMFAAERKHWLFAGLVAGAASATRPMGVLLAIPLVLIYASQIQYQTRKIDFNLLTIGFTGLGIALYMLFQWFEYGTLFEFMRVQESSAWSVKPRLFPLNEPYRQIYLISLGLLIYLPIKHRHYLPYAIWGIAMCAISYYRLHGFGRYVLVIIPCFVALALLISNRWLIYAIAATGLALCTSLAIQFARWQWVA